MKIACGKYKDGKPGSSSLCGFGQWAAGRVIVSRILWPATTGCDNFTPTRRNEHAAVSTFMGRVNSLEWMIPAIIR
jgi:hypothetical protein